MGGLWGIRDSAAGCGEVRKAQLQTLAAERHEEPGEEIFSSDIFRKCLHAAPAKAALGSDQWMPHDWRSLPDEGLRELGDLLGDIEKAVRWPKQVLHNISVFIGKPTTPPPKGACPSQQGYTGSGASSGGRRSLNGRPAPQDFGTARSPGAAL